MSSANNTEVANGQPKTPAQEHNSERAPLLNHDGSGHVGEHDGNAKAGNMQRYFRKSGRWILKNRMVVGVIALLIGGFIALCVYFGGMCNHKLSYAPLYVGAFCVEIPFFDTPNRLFDYIDEVS